MLLFFPACSLDGNFVFSVEVTDINPGNLTVKGHPECRPVVSTADTAVFKIGVTECGTKKKVMLFVHRFEIELVHDTLYWGPEQITLD